MSNLLMLQLIRSDMDYVNFSISYGPNIRCIGLNFLNVLKTVFISTKGTSYIPRYRCTYLFALNSFACPLLVSNSFSRTRFEYHIYNR